MISLTKVGIANQRETTLAWKRSTGELLYDGIVWCDSRTSGIVDRLIKEHNGDVNSLKEKTGLPFATYFSAFKMRWMIENVEAVKQAYEAKDVMFGNVNTFMIYRLSGNKSFFTDASNASRMFLIDLKTVKYDQELLALFGLEENMLPEIKPNFADFGSLSLSGSEISGLSGIPILCSFGDQQSSAFGQNRLSVGETKVTFGTGCFMISNTGSEAITPRKDYLAPSSTRRPPER
jgi:glycerol kinase